MVSCHYLIPPAVVGTNWNFRQTTVWSTGYILTLSFPADFLARMGVWVLDGVVWHSELLPFVLNERNVEDTLVMIVVDLTQPWAVLESLERWTQVVNKHIDSLKVSDRQRSAMEEKSE